MSVRGKVERLLPIINDAEIARRVGCSRERVRQIRSQSGIPNPTPHSMCSYILTEEKLGQIMRRIIKGEWANKIAREENISYATLKRGMDKLGVKIPKTGHGKTFIPWEEMVQSWKKGLTGKECAKRWGVSEITVSRIRKDAELNGTMGKYFSRGA